LNCYGDYYQWGRGKDGHQAMFSRRVGTLANSINKQLTNLGFHGDKLQSFLKIPTEVLLLSINATQKEKIY
jgi:hypothetical protein